MVNKVKKEIEHIVIVNPVAGGKRALETAKVFEALAKELNINCRFICTEGADDIEKIKNEYPFLILEEMKPANEIVHEYAIQDKEYVIHIIGGDGTLNKAIQGMPEHTKSSLAIIPGGTGNDFFKMFEHDKKDLVAIFKGTINGKREMIDYGTVNGIKFLNIVSFGFDASVAANMEKLKKCKLIPRNQLYNVAIFYTVFTYEFPTVNITIDGTKISNYQMTLMAIGNGKYYGGGIGITPNAEYNDGKFELVLARKLPKILIFPLLIKVLRGTHLKSCYVKIVSTAKYIEIESTDSSKPLRCNFDGETIEALKYVIDMKEKSMPIIELEKKLVYSRKKG